MLSTLHSLAALLVHMLAGARRTVEHGGHRIELRASRWGGRTVASDGRVLKRSSAHQAATLRFTVTEGDRPVDYEAVVPRPHSPGCFVLRRNGLVIHRSRTWCC